MTWVRTKVALARVAPGALLEVVLGPGEMLENVPRNVVDDGHELVSVAPTGDGRHLMTIRRHGPATGA